MNITAKGTSHLHAGKSNVNTVKEYNETYPKKVKLLLYAVKITIFYYTVIWKFTCSDAHSTEH